MLSGVAPDSEVLELTKRLSTGEMVRMMELVQSTSAGFNRSAGRRMDAELCVVELCRPELSLDAKAINARLTRLEDQIKSGRIAVAAPPKQQPRQEMPEDEDRPPIPDDGDAPPAQEEEPPKLEAPDSFWVELVGDVRSELKPPASGFFVATPASPIRGVLAGDRLEIRCANSFAAETLSKPEILDVISLKASARLQRTVTAVIVDITKKTGSPKMEQLMNFGRAHQDIVKIRNQ